MRGLKYISWADATGYAVAAKSYVAALAEAGVELTWVPMFSGPERYVVYSGENCFPPQLAGSYGRPVDYDTVLIHTVPEYYPQWIDQEHAAGKRVLGYTVWELERLPDHWPAILNQLDGVIVPCRWNVEVFRNSGVTVPLHVVPHLSQFGDTTVGPADRSALEARIGPDSDAFTFYTIGYWSNRKAPYLAVEAYLRAFTAADPVTMIVKANAKDITQYIRSWWSALRRRRPSPAWTVNAIARGFKSPARLQVIADEGLSDGEMLALHERGDCFVSLARTEGWGLGTFDAARLGKPVVTTHYGGQLDFLDPALAWLVPYSMVPVHEPTWPTNYRPADRWAEPSVADAARMLREIFEDQQAAKRRARQLADDIAGRFGKGATVQALIEALS